MVVVDVVRDNEATPWMSLPYAGGFKHWATRCALHD